MATLLPGAEFSTRSPYPDARRLLDAGCHGRAGHRLQPGDVVHDLDAVCIALAVREMRMTVARGRAGRDRAAAPAPCAATTSAGSPSAGPADLVVLAAPSYVHLAYRPGVDLIAAVWRAGQRVPGAPGHRPAGGASMADDPHWPRASAWIRACTDEHAWPRSRSPRPSQMALLGVPAHRDLDLAHPRRHHTGRDPRRAGAGTPRGWRRPDLDLAELMLVDLGDQSRPGHPRGRARARSRRSGCSPGCPVLALGGDNSITFAVAHGACADGLITLDAHHDLRDGRSNGSPVRRLVESGPRRAGGSSRSASATSPTPPSTPRAPVSSGSP